MGESPLRGCPCLGSLWDRIRGEKPADRSNSTHVEMSPVPDLSEPPQTSDGMSDSGSVYEGLWDFDAEQAEGISFQKGDQFKVLDRSDEWWKVQKIDKNGQVLGTGIVPYNYLERTESLETQQWFFGTMNRFEAEDLLKSPENENGAFLIRRSESEMVGYVLSVRSRNPVRHFKVLQDKDNNYHFESSQDFPSLIDLVEYYIDTGMEGIGKLGEPCKKKRPTIPDSKMNVPDLSREEFTVSLEEDSLYVALWDFERSHEEEMSFQKGDQFKVLGRSDVWWKVQKIDKNGKVLGTGIVPYTYLERAESLEAQPWFFGTLNRSEAETLLRNPENENGVFLIRRSDKDSIGFVFSVNTSVNHFKIQKNKNNNYHLEQTPQFSFLLDLVQHYIHNAIGGTGKLGEPCKKKNPKVPKSCIPEWEQPKDEFTLEEELSQGFFADVYRGTWNKNVNVAIKIIKKDVELSQQEFQRELQKTVSLHHRHLVTLFAVCTESAPFYIVTELMEKGSLLEFLQGPEGQDLDPKSLVDMGAQVADGMAYLEEKKCIHRDLRARNVLVGEVYMCKVADYGLAQVIKEPFYDKDKSKIPYKWCAPEAISHGKFSNKSDVWSFGILLYEIITFGGIPYPAFSNKEVFEQVTNGYRMPCPSKCPGFLYDLMKECWGAEPEHRPTFKILKHRLDNSVTSYEWEESNK